MAPSKHKNTALVVVDLGDGRMAAPGDVVDVDPDAVADLIAAGQLTPVSTPTKRTSEEKG